MIPCGEEAWSNRLGCSAQKIKIRGGGVVKIHRKSKGINCRIHYKESTVGTAVWSREKKKIRD